MADSPVNRANNFSKFVLAKRFPTVFSINSAKKIHRIKFTVLLGNLNCTNSPFINRSQERNKFISIEILSNTYISLSFVSLPPQAIL